MIRKNIENKFPHQLNNLLTTNNSIYVVDYTEQTKKDVIKRGIELCETRPNNIDCFTVNNLYNLEIDGIPFDNDSFTSPDGKPLSQCECVIYPTDSDKESWILFIELKYSNKTKNNNQNLEKAKNQLISTQQYYRSENIFSKTNTCYLLASLPMQHPPFAHSILTPKDLLKMKKQDNIIIRFNNSVEIMDDNKIRV